jgi:AraC-like DNA-binding protein
MKLILKQLNNPGSDRVMARRVRIPCFDEQWHFHPELELIYLIKSRGVRFLGDNIADFSDGELVLTGPNLPHLWRNDPQYYVSKKKDCVDVIIIQFRESFMGNDFLSGNEASRIKQLFNLSKQGILFTGEGRAKVIKLIRKLPEKTGLEQVIDLLTILNHLSEEKEFHLISGPFHQSPFRESEHERINNVSRFLMDHYQENITLGQVAAIANMSPNAFCRYFKKRTNKSLIQFLNEIRISYACKLMIHDKKKISEISMSCGFKSLTLFNRQFRQIMKMNPRKYRNLHQLEQN